LSAISYNIKSSKKYGWTPEWFGASDFNLDLINKIKDFQQEYDLHVDGLCGQMTYRRKYSERLSANSSEFIICNDTPIPIEWGKVILWNEPNGMSAPSGTYTRHNSARNPRMFVNHWDVCLNSATCFKVLKKRGISVHFMIDNDGTIYQTLDTKHIAWHAGRGYNKSTIGVEISNVYYPKYQSWYEKRGFGSRPIVSTAKVRGKTLKEHLGFYEVQKQAASALWKAISVGHGIPLVTPINSDGTENNNTLSKSILKNYKGFVHHYHLTNRKIDCGGFDISKYL
tara:strand:- start:1228 stop:2076 length:849 start_codon:yes stop_codon:yes gene_type:complete